MYEYIIKNCTILFDNRYHTFFYCVINYANFITVY